MPTETINRLITEYAAANSSVRAAKNELRLSMIVARDDRDGPHRQASEDAAYSAHVEHERAVIRANRAHIAICKALTDRGLEFDTRITLVNAVCGNTEVAHG